MIAIYARQSVNKMDSISIETQIEDCQKEVGKLDRVKIYSDKGFSGKNIERPEFQKLLEDIRKGEISKVICYKLDRVSRSVLDFSSFLETKSTLYLPKVSINDEKSNTERLTRSSL